jgi:hypothetical protein
MAENSSDDVRILPIATAPRLIAIIPVELEVHFWVIRRARLAIKRRASCHVSTPATVWATYSPRLKHTRLDAEQVSQRKSSHLWPTTMAGMTPQCIHSRASAYSNAKIAQWQTSNCFISDMKPEFSSEAMNCITPAKPEVSRKSWH